MSRRGSLSNVLSLMAVLLMAEGVVSVTQARGLDDAVSGVRRGNPGRVLSADQVDTNGRREYRIKILTERGEVRRFRIDGDTGRPLPRPGQGAPPRGGGPWGPPRGR